MGDTNESTTITLSYRGTHLEGLRMEGEIWLRVTQIVAPLGFATERGLHNIVTRYADEFTADETRLIVEQTAGGPQQVRVFSLRGARLLAMLARTEPAARFRRWILDLLEGRTPVARPNALPIDNLDEVVRVLATPLVAEALGELDASADADRAHALAQRERRLRARRLAALAGLPSQDLDRLRRFRDMLAGFGALRLQPSLPLEDAEGTA